MTLEHCSDYLKSHTLARLVNATPNSAPPGDLTTVLLDASTLGNPALAAEAATALGGTGTHVGVGPAEAWMGPTTWADRATGCRRCPALGRAVLESWAAWPDLDGRGRIVPPP